MEVVFKDTQEEERLKAKIRKEIIEEVREVCGNCPKLKKIARTEYKRVPKKVRGIYRG
jgi:hypothetical protein